MSRNTCGELVLNTVNRPTHAVASAGWPVSMKFVVCPWSDASRADVAAVLDHDAEPAGPAEPGHGRGTEHVHLRLRARRARTRVRSPAAIASAYSSGSRRWSKPSRMMNIDPKFDP